MVREGDCTVTVEYMKEDGFLREPETKCYVVWFLGPTDGWPRAIFDHISCAKEYCEQNKNCDTIIEVLNFRELCAKVNSMVN